MMEQKNNYTRDSCSSSQKRLLSASISLKGDESPEDFLLPDLNKEVELQLKKIPIKNKPKILLPRLVTNKTSFAPPLPQK